MPLKGIEWSLRAFASMQAVRLFLRARAVISFLTSSKHFRNYKWRGLCKFSAGLNLSFNLADTFKTGQQVQSQAT